MISNFERVVHWFLGVDSLYSEYISKERKLFSSEGHSMETIPGIPKTINNIYYVRQLEGKIGDILKTGGVLLSDLGSWPALKNELEDFLAEVVDFKREEFDGWTRYDRHLSFAISSAFCGQFRQGKKVYKPTAFRCYQRFSLRLLLFLASRVKWLPPSEKKRSYIGLLLTAFPCGKQ